MWNRRKNIVDRSKLNMFLEAIETDEEEDVGAIDSVKQQVTAMTKAGKSVDEIVKALASKVGSDVLGQAIVELKMSEESPSISDAAAETNKKVQDAEESETDEEPTETETPDDDDGESFNIGESEDDLKQIEEASFSKKDYNVVVDIIVNASDKIADELGVENKTSKIKEILAKDFAEVFQADNPRFDMDRFVNAVGK
jgi:hypothetical protein